MIMSMLMSMIIIIIINHSKTNHNDDCNDYNNPGEGELPHQGQAPPDSISEAKPQHSSSISHTTT